VHHFPAAIVCFEQRIDYYRGFWCMRAFTTGTSVRPAARASSARNIQTFGPSTAIRSPGGIISTAKFLPWGVGSNSRRCRHFARAVQSA